MRDPRANRSQEASLSPAANRRQAEVHRHQGESRAHQQLGGGHGVGQDAGSQPQQPFEVEAQRGRRLRVELPPLVHESHGLAGVGHRFEGGQGERRNGRMGPATHQLHQGAAGKPPSQQAIEGRHRCDKRFLPKLAPLGTRQLRGRHHRLPELLRQRLPDGPELVAALLIGRCVCSHHGGLRGLKGPEISIGINEA